MVRAPFADVPWPWSYRGIGAITPVLAGVMAPSHRSWPGDGGIAPLLAGVTAASRRYVRYGAGPCADYAPRKRRRPGGTSGVKQTQRGSAAPEPARRQNASPQTLRKPAPVRWAGARREEARHAGLVGTNYGALA